MRLFLEIYLLLLLMLFDSAGLRENLALPVILPPRISCDVQPRSGCGAAVRGSQGWGGGWVVVGWGVLAGQGRENFGALEKNCTDSI